MLSFLIVLACCSALLSIWILAAVLFTAIKSDDCDKSTDDDLYGR